MNKIICGDSLVELQKLPAGIVQTCVTSPPYYGLRQYLQDGQDGKEFEIGLEQTPEEFISRLVAVFREVKRVLRDDGTLWLNLGDSFSVGSDLADCLQSSIKDRVLIISRGCTLTITSKSKDVLRFDKSFPNKKLSTFFGVKRVLLEKRNNDFRQVLYFLEAVSGVRILDTSGLVKIGESGAEIVLDEADNISIVISENDLYTNPALEIPILSRSTKNRKTPLAIKEPAEPTTETIGNIQAAGDAITLNAIRESILNIDLINQAIPFGDTFVTNAQGLSDFRITKASQEHLSLSLMSGVVELAIRCVGHLFFSNEYGSLIRYSELYDKAKRKANATQAKQELGIPDMVKRALMEDGWICRKTIIWRKPNPMPESVTDRPTKSHEHIFLLSKSPQYYYDADAIKEDSTDDESYSGRRKRNAGQMNGVDPDNYKFHGSVDENGKLKYGQTYEKRNKRDVWTVSTKPYSGAHFATFPRDLILPCILAGSKPGDIVLDPFGGAGTTAKTAQELGREYITIELNQKYVDEIIKPRLAATNVPLIGV